MNVVVLAEPAQARSRGTKPGLSQALLLACLDEPRFYAIGKSLLPAATQRLEKGDQVQRYVGRAGRILLFVLQQAPFGVQHAEEIRDTVVVARAREIQCGTGMVELRP